MESAKKKPLGTRRSKILLAFLVLLGVLWTVSYVQVRALENELAHVAEEKIQEYLASYEGETIEVAVPVITVSKKFLLFGKTTGKVSVYMRPLEGAHAEGEEEEETHSGGHRHRDLSGINFFLERDGGNSYDRESGSCSSEQCQVDGKKAFEKGTHVPAALIGK